MARHPAGKPPLARRERAQRTRQRIIEAATAIFVGKGYAGTTMNAVAEAADVAVQTLYFTFHTKGVLFAEVVGRLSAGPDAGTPVMARPWMQEVVRSTDGQRALGLLVEHGTDIFRRLMPVWDSMMAASLGDPDFAARFAEIVAARRAGMRRAMESLAAKHALHPDVSAEQAANSLFLLQSPELLWMATTTLGWTVERFKAWTHARMLPLLRDATPRAAATRDLSFRAELGG